MGAVLEPEVAPGNRRGPWNLNELAGAAKSGSSLNLDSIQIPKARSTAVSPLILIWLRNLASPFQSHAMNFAYRNQSYVNFVRKVDNTCRSNMQTMSSCFDSE